MIERVTRFVSRLGDFMAWLGGADPEILAEVPRSRSRFTQMAGVLLTTSGIAALSMTFALHDGVKVPLALAILLGLAWGFVILNLDRFLVLSMDGAHTKRTLLLMAAPRLLLAAVLALVISTPLVLRVFASDISAQLKVDQLVNSSKEATLEKNSKEAQDYNAAERKIAADQAIMAGQIPAAGYAPLQTDMANIARLTPKVQADQTAVNTAYEKWQCEVQGQTGAGCPGTSGLSGTGPRAATDEKAYHDAVAAYDQDNGQLQQWLAKEKTDQAAAAGQQKSALTTDEQQAARDLVTQRALVSQLAPVIQRMEAQDTQANQADTGILAQLQALSDASAKNASLNLARLAVLAVFFLIEILPVTVKVLLSLAGPTAYDNYARIRDEEITTTARKKLAESRRIAESESDERVTIAQAQSDSRVNIAKAELNVQEDLAKDMAARKKSLGTHANEHVIGEVGKVMEKALARWSRQLHENLAATENAAHANGSASPGNGTTGEHDGFKPFQLPEDDDL